MFAAGRIDTHHHIVPPDYRDWLLSRGETAGGLPIPTWDVDTDLAFMDGQGIRAAVLSVSTPGTHLGDDTEARMWARKVHDYAAEIVRDRPSRYGFFATLPLPDVDGALEEAARALDELGAAGAPPSTTATPKPSSPVSPPDGSPRRQSAAPSTS
ncbi:amidohydrolase family protein [Streptomyces sp. YGL11-2]|uniref:amidohydrolase family protein n=1 Tax=Streptomyces sp. YGL11-2 TaxID=3414028 RepID=UPI003CE979B5